MRFPGFIGPSYTLQSVNVDCQRCVNLYPEVNELGTGKEREVAALFPTPGLTKHLNLGSGATRGGYTASNGDLFVVRYNKLYKISSLWGATLLGTLSTHAGPVSMADNGVTVVIVDGGYGYTWTIATKVFAQITDADFYAADQVTFQDGYFIFNRSGTQQYFWSDLNAVTFDALDIASAEGSPDTIQGLISANQNLYIFGPQSTEVYYNNGNADQPFQRIQGAVIDVGCSAAFSIAKMQSALYLLGGDSTGQGVVYRMSGYQAQRISTPTIERLIHSLTSDQIALARGWAYQMGGHFFYCLNIPGLDSTWVYDAATNLWHERSYLNSGTLERHRAEWHALFHGKHVVGDYENGNVYELDSDCYTDNLIPIVRQRTAPHISKDPNFLFHSRFELDMETGVGLDGTGQGIDPQVMLQWSDDGGHTWSNERWTSIGAIGKTKTRAVWRRLGSARDRVYRVTISDPVKVVFIGANLEIEEGAA